MIDYPTRPEAITAASFNLIRQELQSRGHNFQPPLADIIERIIHSTADFEFAETTRLSPKAVEAGIQALRQGCAIVCDVSMVQVGLSHSRAARLNCSLHCFVTDAETRQRARATATTRSAMGIRLAAERGLLDRGFVAIGNAPTALYETIRLVEAGLRPALIVGAPVGFVNTVESKIALTRVTAVEWITTLGRKGGSPAAVAIVNALLRLATGAPAMEID